MNFILEETCLFASFFPLRDSIGVVYLHSNLRDPYPYPYTVYKTLTKRNEITRESRNLDKEIRMQIVNRQYASLCNILMKKSESLIWVDFLVNYLSC